MFLRFNFQDDFLELPKEHQSNLLGLLKDNLGDQFKPHKLLPPSLRQVPLVLPPSQRQVPIVLPPSIPYTGTLSTSSLPGLPPFDRHPNTPSRPLLDRHPSTPSLPLKQAPKYSLPPSFIQVSLVLPPCLRQVPLVLPPSLRQVPLALPTSLRLQGLKIYQPTVF